MAHTDLFNLVKSLTPSEKRYFTKWHNGISNKATNQQLVLLDALYKMDEYSNERLIKILGNKVKKETLPPLKNTLFNNILLCLDNYTSINNKEVIIYKKIIRIHLLIRKNLMSIAHKEISETKQLAKKYNVFNAIPSLNLLEFYNKRTSKDYFKSLKNIINEGLEATNHTNTYYRTFIYNLILEYQYYNNTNEFSDYITLLDTQNIVLKKESPKQIRISLHEAKLFEALKLKNDLDALKYTKYIYEDAFSLDFTVSIVNKIIYTSNYALTALKMRKFDLVNELISIIQSINTTTDLEAKHKMQLYYSVTVEYLFAKNEIDSIIKLRESYFKDLKKLKEGSITIVELKILIYFLSAEITNGTLKEAYKLCASVNQLSHKTIKENVSYLTRILELIILFKQKEYTLLNSKINSLKYYFKNKKENLVDFNSIIKLFSLEGKVIKAEHKKIGNEAILNWNKIIAQANFDDLKNIIALERLMPKIVITK